MARKKVTLAFIAKDSARKATFKKRRRGLLKKVSELSTLCEVKACIIIYGLNEPVPETWPPEPEAVHEVIERFNELPDMEKMKKMLNQEGFLKQRVAKLREQHAKLCKENKEVEMRHKLVEGMANRELLNGVGVEEVHALLAFLNARYARVKARYELLVPQDIPAIQSPPVATQPSPSVQAAAAAPHHNSNEEQFMEDFLNCL